MAGVPPPTLIKPGVRSRPVSFSGMLSRPADIGNEPGLGALVEAKVDAGRWIYLGVGLWRQLPAGTDGAYRLMANLISLGKDTTAPTR